MREVALAIALFAITLNFLQPLAHAFLLKDGGTVAVAKLWGAFCLPGADHESDKPEPALAKAHECCLGLTHATVVAMPSVVAVAPPAAREHLPLVARDIVVGGGIRDGPHQPRAPPILV